MGTSIELQIAGITIDWSKNGLGNDHGFLFQSGDFAKCHSDRVDYEYYEQHPEEDVALQEACLARSLSKILPRLNLLGYTIEIARAEFEFVLKETLEFDREIVQGNQSNSYMTFEEFCSFVRSYPLANLDNTPRDVSDDSSKGRFVNEQAIIARIPRYGRNDLFWSEKSYFGAITNILSPYAMLQVFGTDEANAYAEVVWQFGPLVESGWVDRDKICAGARRNDTVLIATEGSSDVHVLEHALKLLRPEIFDFFRFIDVSVSHPFSGTGGLLKFAEGLTKIDIHNQIIFLLDNDAEGVSAHRKIQSLDMPKNMTSMVLPNEVTFKAFPTRGPEGVTLSDINGRAAAIECYLDLNIPNQGDPEILWSNYKKEIDAWHGALQNKENYVRYFLSLKSTSELERGYDTTKIIRVLNSVVKEATNLVCVSKVTLMNWVIDDF